MVRSIIVVGTVCYFVILNWIYIHIISPAFSYYGFKYEEPTSPYFWFSCIISILPSLWISDEIKRPSQLVYWMLYIVIVVPTGCIPFYALDSSPWSLLLMECAIVACFCIIGTIYRAPLWELGDVGLSPAVFWFGFGVLTLLLYMVFIRNFGISFNLPSFEDVYSLRSEFSTTGKSLSTVENYFVSWLGYSINPFLMIYGAVSGSIPALSLGSVGQLYLYSTSGQKSFAMGPVFLLLLLPLKYHASRWIVPAFVWTWSAIMLLCLLADSLSGEDKMTFLLTRRVMVFPSLLTGMYFEYYAHEPVVMMADGLLQFLFPNPPAMSPALVIGGFYFNDPSVNANGNIWASAFAHFSYVGVFAMSLCLAIVFHLYDSLSRKLDFKFSCVLLTMSAFSITNSALPTVLMNHGLALAVLLVAAFPKPQYSESHLANSELSPGSEICLSCPFYRPDRSQLWLEDGR